jgi:hypothetical protein
MTIFYIKMTRLVPVTVKVKAQTAMAALEKAGDRADRLGWETATSCRIYDEDMNPVDPYAKNAGGDI